MKYSKELLVILIIIVLAAAVFLVLETTLENEKSHIDGTYNFALSECTSFSDSDGNTITAPEDQMFFVAAVSVLNIDWYPGMSNDASNFELAVEINGGIEKIQASSYTSQYPANSAAVMCMSGEPPGQNCYLYLVPAGTDISNAQIVFIGSYRLSYDPGLSLELP